MTRAHETVVDAQFGPRAAAYVQSAVHAGGQDLDALEEIVRGARPAHALDLGCGGGHVAYRLAPYAQAVTACDLSAEMLAAVVETARERGLRNILARQAAAEALPFEDAAFDLLACRFSAHHWRDLGAGLAEARRVTRAGAPAVFIDAIAPGRPLLDTHLQAIELLRDTSHVRDYTAGEWARAVEAAGFTVQCVRRHRLKMEFASWTGRMRTPEPLALAVRALQDEASEEVRAYFAIEPDGSFMLDVMMLEASA